MREGVAASCLALALAGEASAVPLMARDILVAVPEGIVAVNPASGESSLVAAGSYLDFSLAPSGEIYALSGPAGGSGASVVRIDPLTGSVETLSSGGLFVGSKAITVNPNGLFVLNRPAGTIQEPLHEALIVGVDRATGAQAVFAELDFRLVGSSGKNDLESDADGNLFAAIAKGVPTVALIDGRTGESHLFRAQGIPEGIDASDIGLGIGPGGEIFVATAVSLEDRLFEFDPETGTFEALSGPAFDVAVEEAGTLLVASDFNVGAQNLCLPVTRCLVRFDPETGEVLHEFHDIRFAREVQIVPVPEPSAASALLLGTLVLRRACSRRGAREGRGRAARTLPAGSTGPLAA
jgi:hypothetical protein